MYRNSLMLATLFAGPFAGAEPVDLAGDPLSHGAIARR